MYIVKGAIPHCGRSLQSTIALLDCIALLCSLYVDAADRVAWSDGLSH